MVIPATTDNSAVTRNINTCRSFNQTLTTTPAVLNASVECSEVLLINKTGQDIYIKDNGYFDDANRLLISDGDSIILRGLTTTDQVSAYTDTGTGPLYYRTQLYSNNPSR